MRAAIKAFLRFYYHHGQAYSLLTLPVNGLGAFSSILVLLNVGAGIKFSGAAYFLMFIAATVILFLAGILLSKMGLIKYWTSLGNQQNQELMEILVAVKSLIEKQGGRNGQKNDLRKV